MRAILNLINILLISFVGVSAFAQGVESTCDSASFDRNVCLQMRTLRAQLHALDAQRELMQVNMPYLLALGNGISAASQRALDQLQAGLPEHRAGLERLKKMSDEMVVKGLKDDPQTLYVANRLRGNCASCHTGGRSLGGHNWDEIFEYDWFDITADCSTGRKNPYLCKSMHGLLSAHSYHRVSSEAGIQDFKLTREAASEIVRILEDLRAKNFRHLPEDRRLEALTAAQEVVRLAEAQDSAVFVKATQLMQTCTKCHADVNKFGGSVMNVSKWSVVK